MSVPFQSIGPAPFFASPLGHAFYTYSPSDIPSSPVWLGWRRLRLHYPEIAEVLEEWYDRTAENCDKFVNISQVDKYSLTCTVCRHFDTTGCSSRDASGVDIIGLLRKAYEHDKLP